MRLDGSEIGSLADFHVRIERALDLGPYYGRNLDALWDRLSADVARPVTLRWTNVRASREALGERRFAEVLDVLERAVEHDRQAGWVERFEYQLLD
ncbi:barstar family protein [Saccharothrix isguenensis]